jgi:PTH1 family peptidyl-tRNA hydrolase
MPLRARLHHFLEWLARRGGGPDLIPRFLIAGLGNPGERYRLSRHNVGFMTLDRLGAAHAIRLDQQRHQARFGLGLLAGLPVVLVQPLAFMNRSGPPTQHLARDFHLSSNDLIVIHDDIDLVFGRLKIKAKGGHGGHNGLRSLMEAFGTGDFLRVRIGVGRPEAGGNVTDHVLGGFVAHEVDRLPGVLNRAQEAVSAIIRHGPQEGMNRFNQPYPEVHS